MNIFVGKSEWRSFSDAQRDAYVEAVFTHYRETGFPYHASDKSSRDSEFEKLMRYDDRYLVGGGIVGQTMHGLSLAWSYMPHSWEVPCNGLLTPMQAFVDDDMLRRVIRKRMKIGDNMSDNGIRKMLKMFSGVQSVSNFRPTAASAIYRYFLPDGGTVYDMSCGYGGRLLGSIKAGVDYVGCEPASATMAGLRAMSSAYAHETKVELHQIGSEDFVPEKDSLDFAFTSPPYFDLERYSDEPTQSWKRYTSKESWLNDFLLRTFTNVHHGLRSGRHMCVNIADTKSYPTLVSDTIAVANKAGFLWKYNMLLALSNSTFTKDKHAFKYEPILVFTKIG